MSEALAWIVMCVAFGGPVGLAAFFWVRREGRSITPEQTKALRSARRSTAGTAMAAVIVLSAGVLWGGVEPVTWGNATAVVLSAVILGVVARLALGGRLLRDGGRS